ncbi:conserved hypothetical protein [Methylobacterium sp. 4-46]|uniref:hypothetical protein n=1 Tax=unclassified Methylobacterium TaxID=2615210 RepID=UPI000152BEDC|nr:MULTISPECIES: hypothetical protein [Methylobacterium]ACA18680.1 conserved hypothetical protein [Methylobacterium sp. 4-46]WFT77914.1 hypothetical protein QA634_21755 [Methylobacterium nodulans]
MTVPYYPPSVWLMAGLDPVLIGLALYLGWKADQFGKLFLVAIVALAVSVLVSWVLTGIGLPWPAPIGHDLPTFFPVRSVAAFLWALAAYAARRLLAGRT